MTEHERIRLVSVEQPVSKSAGQLVPDNNLSVTDPAVTGPHDFFGHQMYRRTKNLLVNSAGALRVFKRLQEALISQMQKKIKYFYFPCPT